MRKMYIQPKVATMVLTVGNLMAPGGGSPTSANSEYEPTNPAPARDPKLF